MSTQPMSNDPDEDLPPHPDNFRDGQGVLDRPAWVAALAEWRGADTEAAPTGEGQGRDGE